MLKALKVTPHTTRSIINYTEQAYANWEDEIAAMKGYYLVVDYHNRADHQFMKTADFSEKYEFTFGEKPRAFMDVHEKVKVDA